MIISNPYGIIYNWGRLGVRFVGFLPTDFCNRDLSKGVLKIMNMIKKKLIESFSSVFPIALIVLILSFSITPLDSGDMLLFLMGSFFLVIGMSAFTMGADMSMLSLGKAIGVSMASSGKIWIITFISFVIGIFITVSEPDLQILATQVSDIESFLLIITVSVGVGIFLAIALLRIVFRINLQIILMVFYAVAIILAFFLPESFRPLAFSLSSETCIFSYINLYHLHRSLKYM